MDEAVEKGSEWRRAKAWVLFFISLTLPTSKTKSQIVEKSAIYQKPQQNLISKKLKLKFIN